MSTGTQILLGVVIALVLFGGWLAMRRRRPVERRPVTPELDDRGREQPALPANTDHLARVRELAAAGRKIEAIKVQRQHSGMGLKEAKQFVEALETTGAPPVAPRTELSLAAMAQVRELVAAGKTIQAVKRVREDTGWGLKQAKDFVDSL